MQQMKDIIVIDDHVMIRNGLETIFNGQNRNYKIVCSVATLSELYDFLKSYNCNKDGACAVLDLQLGQESGFEAIQVLCKKNIAVLIYSMFNTPTYISQALQMGAIGYISKSSSEAEMIQALDCVCKGENYIEKDLWSHLMLSSSVLSSLTPKERLINTYVHQGLTNEEIAVRLNITERTVGNHLSKIYDKFNVKNREELLKN